MESRKCDVVFILRDGSQIHQENIEIQIEENGPYRTADNQYVQISSAAWVFPQPMIHANNIALMKITVDGTSFNEAEVSTIGEARQDRIRTRLTR